jgi:CRISPR-associated endonuclease/helicase Cas3
MELLAKSAPESTTLFDHLQHVGIVAKAFAKYLNMDQELAYKGAILHDIGKAHHEFQKRVREKSRPSRVFRHEISSLLFISLFPESGRSPLIDMIVGHHKSTKDDSGKKGLLDLEEEEDYQDFHIGNWDDWSPKALTIISECGIPVKSISRDEALENLDYVVAYCMEETKKKEISEWRGLLMGADHFASALIHSTDKEIVKCFNKPDLSFFNRTSDMYPLSLMSAESPKKHTMVVACTGAGKTDYLFRRCKGRVFYTLPFQASINAMYKRIAHDLAENNPILDIRVLHASSSVVKNGGKKEEVALQSLIGSAVKVMTPHQLASIIFGLKGYESLVLDLRGCDVILDEIHTYTGVSQAIVIKLVEMLKTIGCSIHIGTATMPTILYDKVLNILGDDVLEVCLSDEELEKFNRHKVFKLETVEESFDLIDRSIERGEKILIVMNRVANAQGFYEEIRERHPKVEKMLLHSRFKRGDRNIKEKLLLGLDDDGESVNQFNTADHACLVVSTQIVEVSLDISFDIMITEAAPLDALAQRFGRVNRKRTKGNVGQTKNIYVIAPPSDEKVALPYELEVLNRTYEVLQSGEIFEEKMLQQNIDKVFTGIDFLNIESHSVFKSSGKLSIHKLTHRRKSILFDLLEIDSVSCICESDFDKYENAGFEERLKLEIPIRYYTVKNLIQSTKGNQPFIIPDRAYSIDVGLISKLINDSSFDSNSQIL